jgi:hypothetical protein
MATTPFQWSEVGGQPLMDRIATARLELWVTVLGLNFAVAGMFIMAAAAFGWGSEQSWWACWLLLGVLLTLCTSRRLCQTLAPLFWLPAFTQRAHSSCTTSGMSAVPKTA